MTAIVGLIHEGKVWLGADSAGSTNYIIRSRADTKVFRNGHAVIAGCGSARALDLLHYSLVVPERLPSKSLDAYLRTDLIDAVRNCFKFGGVATMHDGAEFGSQFLLGIEGRLFTVDGDYQVAESLEPWAAHGSGIEYAMASLWTTHRTEQLLSDPEARLRIALEAAANYNPFVRGPFTILSTE
jgi:ATP-dependent protease HslVU (ClpYQ) peptidase subunit